MKPMRILYLTVILLGGMPGLVSGSPPATWKKMPPAPTARTEVAVAVLEGKIYVLGGFARGGITDRVEAFDTATGRWEERSPLPRPLHHTTASAVNGKLYVIGGFYSGRWTPTHTTYEYDPVKNRWTEKAPMPTPRGALAAGVIDGKIYAVGGAHRKFFRMVNTDANEVYDPRTGRWRKLAPLPTPRDHLTISTVGGKLFAIGGRVNVDYNMNLDANESYDPSSGSWTRLKPLPTPRSGITSQALNGIIYVFGGESGNGTFRENEAYDPERAHWNTMLPMPKGRHGLGSAVWNGGIHLLTGGPNPGGGGSDTHIVFYPGPPGN
ncbi:MAG: Kelch repeat-containing protein [Nitrospinaceae bacterium]